MAPKKNKKKTKSKRYSCELCADINTNRMIQCDECQAKFHLECLDGLPTQVNKSDTWFCHVCEERKKSQSIARRSQQKDSDTQIDGTSQADGSTNTKNRNTDIVDVQSRHSTAKSTGSRKALLELQRIEEERLLKAKRDQEYLDSKYKILMENCSNKSDGSVSEKGNNDREAYTQQWVQQQERKSNSANVPKIQPTNQSEDGLDFYDRLIRSFSKTIDGFQFDETSPLDQQTQPLRNERPPKRNQMNEGSRAVTEHLRESPSKGLDGVGEPKYNSTFAASRDSHSRIQNRSEFIGPFNFNRMDAETRERFAALFPETAKKLLKETPENSSQHEEHNESHVVNPTSGESQEFNDGNTLEWDNYIGAPSSMINPCSQLQNRMMRQMTDYFEQHLKPKLQTNWSESIGAGIQRSKAASSINNEDIHETYDGEFRPFNESTDRQNYGNTESQNSLEDRQNRYASSNTNNRSDRRVEFEETAHSRNHAGFSTTSKDKRNNFNTTETDEPNDNFQRQSTLGSGNIRSGSMNQQTTAMDSGITQKQIASRHVVKEKLHNFSGDPCEWLIWYHQFKDSSELCGYSNAENMNRLRGCLQGKAKKAVEGLLFHPDAVSTVINTLRKLFGRPELIIKAISQKIRDQQPIKADNLEDLMSYAFEVKTITTTIELLERPSYLTDPMLVDDLVSKLPMQEKKDWAHFSARMPICNLKTLSRWLYDMAMILSTVTTPTTSKSNDRKSEKGKFDKNEKVSGLELVNVHVDRNQKSQNDAKPCLICQNECSNAGNCSKFKSLDVNAKWKAVIDNKLCRRCLRKHKNPCKATNVCGKNGCTYKHHFLLHNDERHSPNKKNSSNGSTVVNATASSNFHNAPQISTMLRIVPVILHNGSKSIATFAFLDEGTTVTMMEKRLADLLGLQGTSEQICLIWTKKIHRREQAERVSLEISGTGGSDKRYELKGVRTVEDLNLPVQSIDKNELVAKYPYLRNVPFVSYNNAAPGIMIGSDMPKFGSQLQVVESEEMEVNGFNGPIATRTRLGWTVHGPRDSSTFNEHMNFHQIEICPHHNDLDNDIHQRVKEFFSIENFGVQATGKCNLNSKDEERALEMLEKLTRKVNGRYETGLLWRSENLNLPDSYPMALKRLISLERHGSEMVRTMDAKVADYVSKGYARKLTPADLQYDGPVWYLPLFGVIHPKKPEKIRMVFDAAAKVKTVSLNSVLLKGPDLYTSLIDILRRFRERLVTGGGDIAEMFHQVGIIEKDRHFQRFLFRESSAKEPDVYQMEVLTFGASCSPSSAQFVKNKNAKEYVNTHPRAVSAILDNHYVDDMMESEHSEREMIQLIRDVKMIHAKAGFNIRNFISNSPNVLKAIGESESNDTKDIAPKTELKVERVLGMWYNTKNDNFTFSLKYTLIDEKIFKGYKLPTKREILRTLMSIFDPLGLLSNYLIYLKILIQEIWKSQLDWDTPITSEHLVERWRRWLSILSEVENVKVPRLYSPRMSPNLPKSIQMHVFVDASEEAFAAVIYFRIEDENGVDVALVGSKARAAPIKYLSIPRKELQGSLLGTRLSTSIKNAQRFAIDKRIMWTDSATVISWLNSENRKYTQFVAHRVGEILESSDVNEWRWIPTNENVADEATKWTKTPNFEPTNRWFHGPDFLRLSEDQWPEKKPIKIDIEEEMKANFLHSSLILPQIIDPDRFSKYNRMVRALAYAIRFVNLFNGKAKKNEPLQQEELRKAENLIIRQAQFEGYPTEMVILLRNEVLPIDQRRSIEKPSLLYDGTPYLDADKILRMKGRIDGARELSMDTKRPIVLPKNGRITELLLHDYHSRFFHQNHETVVNEVRQKFYIPRLREAVKRIRKNCQSCKIKKAHPVPPQMSDLPQARLATRFIPFSFVGIDFFGPMYVSIGRRIEKRWGVLFTCLTIRAVHIEIATGLDTNSCILCIQTFVADRGPVIEFHSDWGTNFKGSNNELQEEIKQIDLERLQTEFTSTYTKWIFNPPASPHMGGSWERLIRSVKSSIYEILPTRTPKEDMLRNLMKQVQNVINSRPLTFIPLDVEEDEALTPNHFLRLSSNGLKPPCEIELDGEYLRRSWKESQRLTELFWKRFIREYLPSITRRTKWHQKVAPLKEGDLVLVVDENSPRNTYPKARIVQTVVGSNNQVRQAKVELIAGTRSTPDGKICEVKRGYLWRSAHKLALLDVETKNGLAIPELNSETGGSVKTTTSTDPKTERRVTDVRKRERTKGRYNLRILSEK